MCGCIVFSQKIINKFNFSTPYFPKHGSYGAVTPMNVMAGFRKAGVFPFDPEVVAILTTSDNMTKPQCSEDKETSPWVSSNSPAVKTVLYRNLS